MSAATDTGTAVEMVVVVVVQTQVTIGSIEQILSIETWI